MEGPNARRNRRAWWAACAGVLLAYAATVPRVWQCEGVDEIEYLGLAHSLARGYGYTLYGEPYGYYPPLFPAWLSLFWKAAPGAWRAMYACNALFGALGAIAGASWIRFRFGREGAVAGWLTLFSYYGWSFSTRFLMTEPLFLLMSVGALALAWRVLERNRWDPFGGIALTVLLFLAALTRFGAIALIAAVALAGVVRGRASRRAAGLAVALCALALPGGFQAGWEVRARKVAPAAAETYARWLQKAIGLSKEKEGLIARSVGEGLARETSWPERMLLAGERLGQYASSLVRPPENFAAFGLLLAFLFLVGAVGHLRAVPWSPLGWYALGSYLMISASLWASSYVRYFYCVAPWAFYFVVLGAQRVGASLRKGGAARRAVRLVLLAAGVAGLLQSVPRGGLAEDLSGEALYRGAAHVALGVVYGGLVLVAAGGHFGSGLFRAPETRWLAPVLVGVLSAHNVGLAALRYRLTLRDATLEARNLAGAVRCGEWVRSHTAPGAVCVCSFPRLVAFLADRPCRPAEPGELADGAGYAMLVGPLRDVPAFDPAAEAQLRATLERAAAEGRAHAVYAAGDAVVFRLGT